jgi:hypothetical protein
MVVLAARHDGLEAGGTASELDPLHQPQVVQEVEGAVDAGDAGVAAVPAQPLLDLVGGKTAILAREQSDHRVPCAA